jgi:hypothetical protein
MISVYLDHTRMGSDMCDQLDDQQNSSLPCTSEGFIPFSGFLVHLNVNNG